jgi:hypothetical protein
MVLIDLARHLEAPPAPVLRRRGLRAAYEYRMAVRSGVDDAESTGRAALRDLVDAFLRDRRANADLFERAHRVGAEVESRHGCAWTYSSGEAEYELMCPVYALHRPFAHSLEMTLETSCSICGAGALRCLHVPGHEYGGDECRLIVERILPLGAVALTADPDFLYTWHQPETVPAAKLVADRVIRRPGDRAWCRHCDECAGEPSDGDLDPVRRWRDQVEAARDTRG